MPIPLTEGEQRRLDEIVARVESIRGFLCTKTPARDDAATWYAYLTVVRHLQGNADNDRAFLATLLAKRYLVEHHGEIAFDCAAKAMGAAGLDIDFQTSEGKRVVAEIKTTDPYGSSDFGAAQRASFHRDFAKLQSAKSDAKYLFVTERRAYEVLNRRYRSELLGVVLVLLDALADPAP